MKIHDRSARHAGVSSYSRRASLPCTSRPEFLDRPLPSAAPLMAEIGRDISRLLDAHSEAENNAMRGETHFLRVNLAVCFDLAKRIQSRRKEARALLAKTKGGQ